MIDEMPQHAVNLAEFAISKYPITNAQYQAFIDDGGYTEKWKECWTQAGWKWKEEQGYAGTKAVRRRLRPGESSGGGRVVV